MNVSELWAEEVLILVMSFTVPSIVPQTPPYSPLADPAQHSDESDPLTQLAYLRSFVFARQQAGRPIDASFTDKLTCRG